MSFEKEEKLLNDVKILIIHSKEIEKLKGQTFNIFSILKMETKENAVHSAFIAELLNPRGSHLKGDTFLKLFLKIIDLSDFESKNSRVTIEKHINRINLATVDGGRIDIHIEDIFGRTLCIENKILAGDQHQQIERYCNYNKNKNKVLYLTLDGAEPSISSKGNLISGKDFNCISYKQTIIEWLDRCVKYSAEDPILRESIRQYIILIKKLTGTLGDKKMEKELRDLLLNNLEAATIIKDNIDAVIYEVKNDFRKEVKEGLQKRVGNDFKVTFGNNVDKNYAQLWVFPQFKTDLKYGIEAFSGKGHFDGRLFFGIQSPTIKVEQLPKELKTEKNFGTWIQYRIFENYDGKIVNLRHKFLLSNLYKNVEFREGLKKQIIEEFMIYFDETKENFLAFINK